MMPSDDWKPIVLPPSRELTVLTDPAAMRQWIAPVGTPVPPAGADPSEHGWKELRDDRWPSDWVVRVMPPQPVYDHQSMRESGRPKPHIADPRRFDHTLCGKPLNFWRLAADRLASFDFGAYDLYGCANCNRTLRRMTGQQAG